MISPFTAAASRDRNRFTVSAFGCGCTNRSTGAFGRRLGMHRLPLPVVVLAHLLVVVGRDVALEDVIPVPDRLPRVVQRKAGIQGEAVQAAADRLVGHRLLGATLVRTHLVS